MVTDGTTFVNPVGLWFTMFMAVLIVLLPRRYALVPVIILTCFMTMGQRIIIMSLDFTMLRIIMLFGWVRLLLRGEIQPIKWNAIDKAILWWTLSSMVAYTLLWQTTDAFINRLGHAYNAIGMYFLFRFLVRDFDEIKRAFTILAVLILPLAIFMLVEKNTGRNAFAVFGGVPEMTAVRDGVLRCQGPFAHPILAGTFGATALPLFVASWWQRGWGKLIAVAGIVSSSIIVVTAASSGPLMAYLFGIIGLTMWPLRMRMRAVRWGVLLLVIALHLVMKAPVWFLVGRVGVFSASTGWHRGYLIDRAIAHFDEWWFIGTKSTAEWGYHLSDITNQYIVEGVNGGLLTMILFITIIGRCFEAVGRALRAAEGELLYVRVCLWGMGAALLAHIVTFLSVSYFDQNIVSWYLLLAMISSASGVATFDPRIATNAVSRSQAHLVGPRLFSKG